VLSQPDVWLVDLMVDSGMVGRRSHEERRCCILGPTQSRISPSILWYTKIKRPQSATSGYRKLVFMAHRLVYRSTLGLIVIKKKKRRLPEA